MGNIKLSNFPKWILTQVFQKHKTCINDKPGDSRLRYRIFTIKGARIQLNTKRKDNESSKDEVDEIYRSLNELVEKGLFESPKSIGEGINQYCITDKGKQQAKTIIEEDSDKNSEDVIDKDDNQVRKISLDTGYLIELHLRDNDDLVKKVYVYSEDRKYQESNHFPQSELQEEVERFYRSKFG